MAGGERLSLSLLELEGVVGETEIWESLLRQLPSHPRSHRQKTDERKLCVCVYHQING